MISREQDLVSQQLLLSPHNS
uniref:Uncharacterized protein n=1 Tax=Arundo donax TaxID=35708 RepID=A0A0A8ZFI8_ARUDO